MGGGYRVGNPDGYGPGALTEFPTADDYAMAVGGTAKELCAEWDLGTPRLILEAGGYLVTDAVALLARVGLRKTRRAGGEAREWASIENTSGLPLRPPADVPVPPRGGGGEPDATTPPTRASRSRARSAPTTTSPTRSLLPALRRGDLIAVLDNGSYCEAVTSDYCAVPIPPSRDGVGGPRRDHATARDRR